MPFEPHRVPKESLVYRGLGSKGWLHRQRDPWGVKFAAFLRKRKDQDGLSVVPEPSLCFALSILQIARLNTGQIEEIENPLLRESLYVWRDAPEHACIRNLPFHDESSRNSHRTSQRISPKYRKPSHLRSWTRRTDPG